LFSKIIPPVYFIAALLLMVGLHHYLPTVQMFSPPVTYIGTLFIIAGCGVTAWGGYAFHKSGTPVKPFEQCTALITHGLYRYTRNPMYLGMIIILAGVWIILGSLSPLPVIPVFILLIQEIFIKQEEPFLERIFGDHYREYKASVRRWL
jgi:protein-S-isoprenylcysteine O-methyltransferase Ste14